MGEFRKKKHYIGTKKGLRESSYIDFKNSKVWKVEIESRPYFYYSVKAWNSNKLIFQDIYKIEGCNVMLINDGKEEKSCEVLSMDDWNTLRRLTQVKMMNEQIGILSLAEVLNKKT